MDDHSNSREFYAERAAIMEIDGGMKRYDAEFYAIIATHRYCQRTGINEPDDVRYHLTARHLVGTEPCAPGTRFRSNHWDET